MILFNNKLVNINGNIILKKMYINNRKINACNLIKMVSSKEFNRYERDCKKYFFHELYLLYYEF